VTTPAPMEAANGAETGGAVAAGMPPQQMIDDLLGRHEELSRKLREDVSSLGDRPTAELLQRLADFHDTTAWMLRMLLETPDSRTR
jgi:DNA-binding ferritin-like protein